MRHGLVWILAIGCGGKDTAATDSTDSSSTSTDVETDPCADVPSCNFEGMDCDGLDQALARIVDAAEECAVASDCVLIRPQCETWNTVNCYYPVNKCLDPSVIAEMNAQSGGCTLGPGESCVCGAPPEVDCVKGRCELVDY